MHMRHGLTALALLGFAGGLGAQFGNEWVSFTRDDSRLSLAPNQISNNSTETDLFWGDLDKDGDDDLVVVRKQPFTTTGKRTNLLLMNEGGVLVNRTGELATASDVAGDNGFATETNDRDVEFADVDQDGWLDVITATTLSDGFPKAISHPRVYMNLGEDAGGDWLGLEYQEARIPQFFTVGGQPANPRFCGMSTGDVTGDGFPDIYFADYDSGPGGSGDLNDRLLVNDGFGFFTDESQLRMTPTMLQSGFGTSAVIGDLNLDGTNDIVKNENTATSASYNNPNNEGFFGLYDQFQGGSAYHTSMGDLNNDGRLDAIVSDDGSDRYRYNLGTDAFGRVVWGTNKTFQFLAGFDDGFGSDSLATDLDGDGWQDVVICDVDVDISGTNRRIHIYHNPGGVVGSEITLREERQQAGGGGWLGAPGLKDPDLEGGHDVASFDLDGDGDNDLVLSRADGTFVWMNDAVGGPDPWEDLGEALAGTAGIEPNLEGSGTLLAGSNVMLALNNALGNAPAVLFVGLDRLDAPFKGGVLVPQPDISLSGITTTAAGTAVLGTTWPAGVPSGTVVYYQMWIVDAGAPAGLSASNALSSTTP